MNARYLLRKRDQWVFQIRVPRSLDPDSTLSPIRLTIGALDRRKAIRAATAMAAAAQSHFAKLERKPMATRLDPKDARNEIIAEIERLMPMWRGLDAIDPDGAAGQIGEATIDHIFDRLAILGAEASGRKEGAGGQFDDAALFVAALQNREIAKILEGRGDLAALSDQTSIVKALRSLSETVTKEEKEPEGDRFSVVVERHRQTLVERSGENSTLARTFQRVGWEFVRIVGDKPVTHYRKRDIEHYAAEIAWLPPNATSKPSFDYGKIKQVIARNKRAKGKGLARKTVMDGRVPYIKKIIEIGCDEVDRPSPVFGKRIAAPQRATPPKKHRAPSAEAFDRALRLAVEHTLFTETVMLALAYLTGRRIGLLTHLRREMFLFEDGIWVINPSARIEVDGKLVEVPYKTEDSLDEIVLPTFLTEIGLVEWAVAEPGWLFEPLMATPDPADAASKRMGRFIKSQLAPNERPWVVHGLRSGRINADRDEKMSDHLVRVRVGHAASGVHEEYGELTPKQRLMFAEAPLPHGVNWDVLRNFDWGDAFRKDCAEAAKRGRWRRRRPSAITRTHRPKDRD